MSRRFRTRNPDRVDRRRDRAAAQHAGRALVDLARTDRPRPGETDHELRRRLISAGLIVPCSTDPPVSQLGDTITLVYVSSDGTVTEAMQLVLHEPPEDDPA